MNKLEKELSRQLGLQLGGPLMCQLYSKIELHICMQFSVEGRFGCINIEFQLISELDGQLYGQIHNQLRDDLYQEDSQ